MIRMKKILDVVMRVWLGYYVGHCIFVCWNHYKHPEFYAIQSAPWYTSLWVDGIAVLAVVLACTLVKFILSYIGKIKKP